MVPAVDVSFPPPLASYAPLPGASLPAVLAARVGEVPFNLAATLIFLAAVVHCFLVHRFQALAHALQRRHDQRLAAAGRAPAPSVPAELLRFLGEVEVVFGLWAAVLLVAIEVFYDWSTATRYFSGSVSYTEALFVVVIMALAASQPIVVLAEGVLSRIARLGGGTPAAWWWTILSIAPPLGSFITGPAAMAIGALLLGRKILARRPRPAFAYTTLGLLFVNVSVGGALSHYASPPILMVARPWSWDTRFVMAHFGWKAMIGIGLANALCAFVFRRELRRLGETAGRQATDDPNRARVPGWVVGVNVAFMVWTVANAEFPALFLGGFLFFLGFAQATAAHQAPLDLRPPLLVGFFLAGLVLHGGLQGWWIAPLLARLGPSSLFIGSAALTAFNDNALVTYLATLVPNLSDAAKYAVVAGAVTGGGLTVIANAPNPVGQSILGPYFEDGISPLGLFLGALGPTLLMALCFLLL